MWQRLWLKIKIKIQCQIQQNNLTRLAQNPLSPERQRTFKFCHLLFVNSIYQHNDLPWEKRTSALSSLIVNAKQSLGSYPNPEQEVKLVFFHLCYWLGCWSWACYSAWQRKDNSSCTVSDNWLAALWDMPLPLECSTCSWCHVLSGMFPPVKRLVSEAWLKVRNVWRQVQEVT